VSQGTFVQETSKESMMAILADFPITARWPATHPDRIQLYSFPTPNGVKVSIALEELGLPYEAHAVIIGKNESRAIGLFESGAILLYLAEKTGRLIPSDPARRHETIQWLFFQMAGVGPMFGQVGYFNKFAGREIEDKRPLNRYAEESRRLLGVMEGRLDGRRWFMDEEYTIADIAHLGWVRNLIGFYDAGALVGMKDFPNVQAWLERGLARPATQAGLNIPPRP
jgi:GST-like protein